MQNLYNVIQNCSILSFNLRTMDQVTTNKISPHLLLSHFPLVTVKKHYIIKKYPNFLRFLKVINLLIRAPWIRTASCRHFVKHCNCFLTVKIKDFRVIDNITAMVDINHWYCLSTGRIASYCHFFVMLYCRRHKCYIICRQAWTSKLFFYFLGG